MLRANQPHSALHLVNLPQDQRCNGCLEIKAKCCSTLGRHRQAREALEDVLKNPAEVPSRAFFSPFMRPCPGVSPLTFPGASQEQRTARNFPEEAILHCRSGLTAMRGNLPDQAHGGLLRALSLNPMIWEAFEGLCRLGESAHRRIMLQSLLMSSLVLQDPYPRSKICSLHALRQLSALPQMSNNNSPRQGQHTLHARQLPDWASSHLTMATPETCSEDLNHLTPYQSVWGD